MIGIVLGIGIITAFVFLGSEETIDAPRLDDEQSSATQEAPAEQAEPGDEAEPAPETSTQP